MNQLMSLPLIDLLSLAYLLVAALLGLKRGLSGELARVASMVLAVLAGWRLHGPLGEWFTTVTRLEGNDAVLAGFLTAVLGAAFVLALLRWFLRKIMALSFHPLVNRVGGILAGGLRGLLVVSMVFVGVSMCRVPYLQRKFIEESRVGTFVMNEVLPLYTAFSESIAEKPVLDSLETLEPEDGN